MPTLINRSVSAAAGLAELSEQICRSVFMHCDWSDIGPQIKPCSLHIVSLIGPTVLYLGSAAQDPRSCPDLFKHYK